MLDARLGAADFFRACAGIKQSDLGLRGINVRIRDLDTQLDHFVVERDECLPSLHDSAFLRRNGRDASTNFSGHVHRLANQKAGEGFHAIC